MTEACEFPKNNSTSEEIKKILRSYKTVAVVGLSDKPERPSYRVAAYLKEAGFRIIPVNPNLSSVLGEKAYPDLKSIPGPVEIVDIFRNSADVPAIVDEAIAKKARVIWMQEGIVNNVAADLARHAGLQVVMNKCMLKEHRNDF
ncbi:MAG: CoA-binding protein [Candidatus Omnitrophica bacterium]|nr:CoA-binding protein [Candidatus Omnitrophota bacterium]